MESQASQQLSGGLLKTLLAFRMQGRLKEPAAGVGSEMLRFERRFTPITAVMSSRALTYEHFRDMCLQVTSISTPVELFTSAFQCFDEARRILTSIPDPSAEVS